MNLTMTSVDIAIGLSFVYLLMSLMCSVLQEIIANVTSWRGKHLKAGIRSMLNDPTMTGLARRLYLHPRIATLSLPGKLPSYIPSATFAKALADLVVEDGNLNANVDGPLAPFIRDAAGQVDKLEAQFAQWFDDSMDRLSGWYKRNVQLVLFALGLGLAAALNVSTLEIARALWTQPLLREAVAQSAGNFYKQTDATQSAPGQQPQGPNATNGQGRPFESLEKQLNTLTLPIGWDTDSSRQKALLPDNGIASLANPQNWRWAMPWHWTSWPKIWNWLALIAGWLMTALAASLGTQFWFKTLGEALQLRAAGAKPPKGSGAASTNGAGG